MKTKQELLISVLAERLPKSRVGLLVKGVSDICPTDVMQLLTADSTGYVSVAVGYDCSDLDAATYKLRTRIEDAVKWRSEPELAGKIVVFVCNDSDKLHSLKELDVVTIRSISECLVDEMVNDAKSNMNQPRVDFCDGIKSLIDNFSFETLFEFASVVEADSDKATAIPRNMWRLGLLCDAEIHSSKNKSLDRLVQNQKLIIAIGQISEEHRKRMTTVLWKTTDPTEKSLLRNAYRGLQNFFKYGKKEILKDLDYETVKRLILAANTNKKKKTDSGGDDNGGGGGTNAYPVREKELNRIIARCTVKPEEGDNDFLDDVYSDVVTHFGEENNAASNEIQTKYGDRPIILDNHATPLRRLVHLFCTEDIWGGVLETEETTLRNAVSAQSVSTNLFCPDAVICPDGKASICSCDRDLSLFECLRSAQSFK